MNGELIQFPKTCSICDQYSQSFQEIEQSSSCFKKVYSSIVLMFIFLKKKFLKKIYIVGKDAICK